MNKNLPIYVLSFAILALLVALIIQNNNISQLITNLKKSNQDDELALEKIHEKELENNIHNSKRIPIGYQLNTNTLS
ncbi:MAG: hypothetical protein M9897_11355 [Brumimicrobium sp.]|nr:hypothetical protein [Brumimicrobium sp.]